MNTVAQGTDSDYAELKTWFEQLWNRPQAHAYKTVDGKKVDCKEYLLAEIVTLFKKYTPRDVYYKVLFELFGDQIIADINNPDLNRKMGRLENTVVYKAGKLEVFKKDLKADIDSLDTLKNNHERFAKDIDKETTRKNNLKSRDDKLQVLIEKIRQKRSSGENNDNQKVLVFTVYRDTALYLYEQLKARGFDRIGFVSGSD